MKHYFTLIELLITVAIIAILAAILLPALNMARSKAQLSQCISNVKTIGYWSILYSGDFGDYFVPGYYAENNNAFSILIRAGYANERNSSATSADARSPLSYICPVGKADPYHSGSGMSDDVWSLLHYATNNFLTGYPAKGMPTQKRSKIKQASQAYELIESYYDSAALRNCSDSYSKFWYVYWRSNSIETSGARRHNGFGNFGFVDGHVGSIRPTSVSNCRPYGI